MLLLCITAVLGVRAQKPVEWKFEARKVANGEYEVHLIATVAAPWHIYSQQTPAGGPAPTIINYNRNPLLLLDGKTEEAGRKITRFEKVFDVDVIYFEGKADFVQRVKVKGNAKTSLNGKISFMVCNNEQCMPPASINFSVLLR